VDSLLPLIQGEPLAPVDFDLTTAGFRVAGRVGQMWPRHLLHYRCASVKAKDRLNLWIDHLLLQTSSRPGYPKSSVLLAKDGGWRLCPPANAQEILNQLLNCYWEGLRKPLPFFPQSAYVFAERRRQGKNDEEALNAARKVWMGDRHSRPEAEDPYYDLNWGNVDPVDERFRELAVTLFGPLLEHEEKLEL
jgi:exodeoxyribonuclease V gamma subunit